MKSSIRTVAGLLAGALLGLGCAAAGTSGGYRYFQRPGAFDPWSFPIARWQAREAEEPPAAAPAPPASLDDRLEADLAGAPLRARYSGFVSERRRLLAAEVTRWVQEESRVRYVDDGAVDFWPTFDETLSAGQEDCDGLELLTYNALQELGFAEQEVFRAILRHRSLEMHHMVTLWFEDPMDPWVLDPTGTITTPMRRMSQIDHWVPVKLFTESIEYTVRPDR